MERIVKAVGLLAVGLIATLPAESYARAGGHGGRGMGMRASYSSYSGRYCGPRYCGYRNFCYSSRCWSPNYGCYLYSSPWDSCYYYWYAPSSCYYPVSYFNAYPPVVEQPVPTVAPQPAVAASQVVNVVNGSPGLPVGLAAPGPRVAVPAPAAGPGQQVP